MNSRKWLNLAIAAWVVALFIGAIWMTGEALASTCRPPAEGQGLRICITAEVIQTWADTIHKNGFEGGE